MKLAGVLFSVLALAIISTAAAQEPSTRWILGVWEGAHQHPAVSNDSATFEFTEEGATIKWKMVRRGIVGFRPVELEASGVVTKLSETSAELEGKYDRGDDPRAVGGALKYSLTRSGESLDGSAVGALGRTFHVSLKRIK